MPQSYIGCDTVQCTVQVQSVYNIHYTVQYSHSKIVLLFKSEFTLYIPTVRTDTVVAYKWWNSEIYASFDCVPFGQCPMCLNFQDSLLQILYSLYTVCTTVCTCMYCMYDVFLCLYGTTFYCTTIPPAR